MRSFLLVGQSNAAGRGYISEAEPLNNDNLYVLRNGRWRSMFRPINPDRSFSGVSFAETFSRLYADKFGCDVGIVPCADGGTSILEWQPNELLFDNAVISAKLAMRTSTLEGILWHQGEADCLDDRYPFHEERLLNTLNELKKQLGVKDIPIIIGGLGDYLAECELGEGLKNYDKINEALKSVASKIPNCAFVSAEGLTSNEDFLHFNTKSLIEFGKRYFKAYEELVNNK